MIIFLGIAVELATVIGSVAILINASLNSLLEISKNGYKIDIQVLEKYSRKGSEKEKQKINDAKRLLGAILLFVPVVNLITAIIDCAELKENFMDSPQIKEAIVPMTDTEKEQYEKMDTKIQKLTCTLFDSVKKKEEEEFFKFLGKRPIVVDHELTSLYYEELMPLDYTLDEVKRLNEATTYSYRIGKIDGKNVAIIGIPNSDSPVSRIQFKAEDYKITHTYEKMTEEEAKDKTFTVYPFTIHDDTQADVFKVIQEIRQSRIDNTTKANLEALEVQPRFEWEIIPTEIETVLSEEQQGPRLVKTVRPQIDKK